MDHVFSTSSSPIVKQLRWRLERVRIVCSLESEFDREDEGKYYVHDSNSGKKFVVVRTAWSGQLDEDSLQQ